MSKHLIALLLAALLAGHWGQAPLAEPSPPPDPSEAGLTMELEHPVYDPSVTSCTYFVHNDREESVDLGEPYHLQYWEEGRWKDAPALDFNLPLYRLAPGETMALTCSLRNQTEPGYYRMVKEVGGETLYAQFQLGESLYTAEHPYGFAPLEELEQIPDVPGPVSPEDGEGDLAQFVWKAGLGVPCQLRLI